MDELGPRGRIGAVTPFDDRRLRFLVGLRQRIAEEISGVQDAGFSLFWDDTRPNWMSRSSLSKLFREARDGAEDFGLFIARRHCHCGARSHTPDYIMDPLGGRPLAYQDDAFLWNAPLDQGEEYDQCACSSTGKVRHHSVIYDILHEKAADQAFCAALEMILRDLYEAVQRAGDRKPRSGIREQLLRALLQVNDEILPESVGAYIARSLPSDAEAAGRA